MYEMQKLRHLPLTQVFLSYLSASLHKSKSHLKFKASLFFPNTKQKSKIPIAVSF